mmetsp:Transcript_14398/g.25396  ORF Transcript_14398/g.25396 Transcript_14398/m.25396 type:complete len:347 (-) Transcript_14398:1604-2644(-)
MTRTPRVFFKEHNYFGLKKEDVFFFAQGTLPCMTNEGKIILQSKNQLAVAPDGNGGIYMSMLNSGALADMEKRGIESIHVCSVDNAIARVADPVFVGYCRERKADVGNKGCPKVSWDEKVGVMAKKDGKFSVVEYTEITEENAKQTSSDGSLLFSTGNICNHYFSVEFIRSKVLSSLSNCYHIQKKKIPAADDKGETVKPTENNGIKLEMYIFDVFPLASTMAILECDRASEFTPVKNAPGSATDSPDTARAMIFAEHKKWLLAAGGKVTGEADAACEISGLVSYAGEDLKDITESVESFALPLYIRKSTEAGADKNEGEVVSKDGAKVQVTHFVNTSGVNVYQVK